MDKRGEDLLKNPEKSLPSLLVVIDRLFSNLEGSFSHLHAAREVKTLSSYLIDFTLSVARIN